MPDIETLNHTTWDCKYHVVFIPKYRRKALYHELRRHLGEVFRALAAQKECQIEEGHLMADHVPMLLVRESQEERLAPAAIERHAVDRRAVAEEVERRVHVRAAVEAHRQVAAVKMPLARGAPGGLAGKGRRVGRQGMAQVDHAAGIVHNGTSIVLLVSSDSAAARS